MNVILDDVVDKVILVINSKISDLLFRPNPVEDPAPRVVNNGDNSYPLYANCVCDANAVNADAIVDVFATLTIVSV